MSLVIALHHLLAFDGLVAIRSLFAVPVGATPQEEVPLLILASIGEPIFVACEILIPAAIAISAIHKLNEHRESAMTVCIELVVKGGGTVLALQVVKHMLQ